VTTQPDGIALRQYVLDDYDAVYAFWRSMERGIGLGMSDTREEIEKKHAHAPDLFLLAEDAGTLVGTVVGGFDGRRGMIYHLAVAPGYRKQGLGERLMNEIEARLKAKGCRKAYLLAHKTNQPAIAFYDKRGWSDMTDHVIIMGKEL
jgi:ribosomal protein S18 acetylase RimI-like enzyme